MIPLPDNTLELSVLVFKNTHSRNVEERQLSGVLSSEVDFCQVHDRLEDSGLWISGNIDSRKIECHLPGEFFDSIEGLMGAPVRRIHPPEKFYLAEEDVLYVGNDNEVPSSVNNYLSATKLWGLLAKLADHEGGVGSARTLVFLQNEKLEIEPKYNVNNLRDLSGMAEFRDDFIDSDTHRDQKKTIVKTVLMEMFAGQGRVSFGAVLEGFVELLKKVQASYQLYVSEFSFQKVKTEIEREKLEATIKLNKVFSDVQNQLLAVPAALLLVGGQIVDSQSWSSKNIVIWLGVLVFAIFMTLLVRNQRHTLTAVKQEIDQQWTQIRNKHHSVAERFSDAYGQLGSRYRHQLRLIWVVDFLVSIALGVATGMLLHVSVSEELMIESMRWGGVGGGVFILCIIPGIVTQCIRRRSLRAK